jgi:hypothetical protein
MKKRFERWPAWMPVVVQLGRRSIDFDGELLNWKRRSIHSQIRRHRPLRLAGT